MKGKGGATGTKSNVSSTSTCRLQVHMSDGCLLHTLAAKQYDLIIAHFL